MLRMEELREREYQVKLSKVSHPHSPINPDPGQDHIPSPDNCLCCPSRCWSRQCQEVEGAEEEEESKEEQEAQSSREQGFNDSGEKAEKWREVRR